MAVTSVRNSFTHLHRHQIIHRHHRQAKLNHLIIQFHTSLHGLVSSHSRAANQYHHHSTKLNCRSHHRLINYHHTQTAHQPLQSPQNQTELSNSPLPHQPIFDNVVTVDNNTQFLEYLPNVNTADENLGSLPVIEGPGELMKEFLIVKRKK